MFFWILFEGYQINPPKAKTGAAHRESHLSTEWFKCGQTSRAGRLRSVELPTSPKASSFAKASARQVDGTPDTWIVLGSDQVRQLKINKKIENITLRGNPWAAANSIQVTVFFPNRLHCPPIIVILHTLTIVYKTKLQFINYILT